MKKIDRIGRIRAFIILRLFIVTLLLFLANYVFRIETLIFYYIIAAVCVLSVVYLLWLIYAKRLGFLMWLQIVGDTLLETILIYYTGGVDSLFAPIYVLSIISAGILIVPWASFIFAGFCSVLFSGLVVLNQGGMVPKIFPAVNPAFDASHDNLYLFYATYVRITIFFVVAILTNYLTAMILKLEEKIRLQQRLAFLGDITSRIAHEIRNPLAAISGSIEVLAGELGASLGEKHMKLMNAAVDESERLKRVFSRILDYARMDDIKPEKVSLDQLMDRVLLTFEHNKEFNGNVSVVRKYQGKKVYCEVDPEQMRDAFSNVIRNSYEAMRDGGLLAIQMTPLSEEIEVAINDTGEGIKKETFKTLFAPFKTTKKTGAGLGLAQVQKIVSLHGGRVSVSSHPGKGTSVRIFLRKKT